MDVTFLGPCLYKKKIKELAGSSYKIPRQGKPCRVDSNTWGCDQTDLFPGSWDTNSHSALPPSSWLSLMITNGSINLPQAAWESHQDRWDLSSPQKPSEEGFLSFWRRVSELRQKDEQHHFSPACMHTTSESLKPPRCEFASRPGRAGQGFFWERRICDLLHCTGKYSASERQFCLSLKSSSLDEHSDAVRAAWHPCRNLLTASTGKGDCLWQLGTPKGRGQCLGTEIQPFLLPPLQAPSAGFKRKARFQSCCQLPLPCACQAHFSFPLLCPLFSRILKQRPSPSSNSQQREKSPSTAPEQRCH